MAAPPASGLGLSEMCMRVKVEIASTQAQRAVHSQKVFLLGMPHSYSLDTAQRRCAPMRNRVRLRARIDR